MFKILILQRLYNLSDQQVEYQINDRLSFCHFLGLPLGGSAPDFSTVWRFREALVKAGSAKALFDLFEATLESKGLITREGTMVDVSFVEVPKQRNSRGGQRVGQESRDPRKLEGQARQAPAEGSRRSLEQEERRIVLWIQEPR